MVVSRQLAYFDGSLESVCSAALLDFPPQLSVLCIPEQSGLRGNLEEFSDMMGFQYHNWVEIGAAVLEPDDLVRKITLIAGIAEYVYGANVLHMPVARHTLLAAERRMVHKFAYAEGETAKRTEEGFFRVSTPLASKPLSAYVRKLIKAAQRGDTKLGLAAMREMLHRAVNFSCPVSRDIYKSPCGQCETCVWNHVAVSVDPVIKVQWQSDPRRSSLLQELMTMNSFDQLNAKDLRKAQWR